MRVVAVDVGAKVDVKGSKLEVELLEAGRAEHAVVLVEMRSRNVGVVWCLLVTW